MTATIKHIIKRIKEGMLQEMWRETRWIYQYARHYWKPILFYTLWGLFGSALSLSSSMVSKNLVDIITGHNTGELLKTFAALIGLSIGNSLIGQISSYISAWIGMRVDAEIKADIFAKMLVTDWESIDKYHTGDLLTRWGSDSSNISNGILSWVPNLIIYTFRFISAFAVVIYYDASFAFFALLGAPVSMLMSKTLVNRMRNNNKRSAAMNAKMSGFNQEAFSNIQTIKAFDLISFYINKLKNIQKEYIGMKLEFQRMSMMTAALLSLTGLLVSYSSYGWGIYRVWSGVISYGTMTMFLSLSATLTSTLDSLISLVPTAISLTTSAGRLMDIVEMPVENYELDDEVNAFQAKYRHTGISLHLSEMDYHYKNGTQVFQKASMEAHPHEIIALVGPSGEGKTTMLRLILSLLYPQSGDTYLSAGNGRNEERIPLSPSSRKLFSYVPQGNTMFSGTIAENMRNVKPDATDEEIRTVLETACAWEFVRKLPDGIHSPIKERGGGISEGQSQRLSIARALLRKSPVLLLDEATSALDVKTEREVLRYAISDKRCKILNQEEIDTLIRTF